MARSIKKPPYIDGYLLKKAKDYLVSSKKSTLSKCSSNFFIPVFNEDIFIKTTN